LQRLSFMKKIRSQAVFSLLGRALMSAIFISSGINKFLHPVETSQYMASKKLPLIPLLRPGAAFLETASGLSLLLGLRPALGAAAGILFLLPTTLIFNGFWGYRGAEREMQVIHFMKNLAILGGFFSIVAYERGRRGMPRGRLPEEASPRERRVASLY
jgi:putative oxidoreductase